MQPKRPLLFFSLPPLVLFIASRPAFTQFTDPEAASPYGGVAVTVGELASGTPGAPPAGPGILSWIASPKLRPYRTVQPRPPRR